MNDNDEPPKTVAILALQSPVLCVSEEKWQRIAELFASRLLHPVAVVNLLGDDPNTIDLQSTIEWYARQGFQRFVIMPMGLGDFDLISLFSVVAWMRAENLSLQLHVARSWTTADWAEAILPAICEALEKQPTSDACDDNESRRVILFVGQGNDRDEQSKRHDGDPGIELASLAYHCQQADDQIDVRYSFLEQRLPRLRNTFRQLDLAGIQTMLLVAWRLNSDEIGNLFKEIGDLHGTEFVKTPIGFAWRWNRFSIDQPTPIELLEHPAWLHIALGCYLDSLSKRSLERYFTNGSLAQDTTKVEHELIALDLRIDSMLPTEYQGRAEEVSPQSMGSVAIPSNEFGKVPWDEIWTSFCDLAMAGGPPHRGRLLEAVAAEEAKADPEAYDRVVAEIIRGVEMITGLKAFRADALGWVGVSCDDETMAVWLMRAIIVENVIVRREGSVLYLPAGPAFKVTREVKNVITAIAKTVHYWRAHLRQRSVWH